MAVIKMVFAVNSDLCHHGIKGQKWGIRRYQNADGSLTAAGKKRYGVIQEAADKASKFAQYARDDRKKYQDQLSGKTKKTGVTTDSDLKRWISVTEAQEKRYSDMVKKYKNMNIGDVDKKTLKDAKSFVKDFFTEAEMSDYKQDGRWKNYQSESFAPSHEEQMRTRDRALKRTIKN